MPPRVEEGHMTISGATRSLATAAVVTIALIAPAQAAPAPAGAARASGAMTGAPAVGACSAMTPAEAAAKSDTSSVVPCRQSHTARVAGVVKLPASMDWDGAGTKALYRVVAARCAPQVWTTLGRTPAARALSAYTYVWFEPTKAQKGEGARWLSCSIILPRAGKFADLPTNRSPMLPRGKRPDAIAHCMTKALYRTTCSARHAWRATGTFKLEAATRPAVKSLNRTAARRCLSRVDRHKKYYRYTYPDPATWAAGDHQVVCFSRGSK
jgi:hypothetical protein